MARYEIEAKRPHEKEFTAWAATDDLERIQFHVNNIRSHGYVARVRDPKISEWEKKQRQGYLLFTPVRIGQTVYAVVDAQEPYIEEWTVKSVAYDGEKWYAVGDNQTQAEVGGQECLTSIKTAKKLLEELKKEKV